MFSVQVLEAKTQRLNRVHAGLPTKILFRNVEQSELEIQRKMARAHEAALDADYISRELSSPTTWLSELQAYAARQQPANVTADGTVEPAAFYTLLDEFLVERVRPLQRKKKQLPPPRRPLQQQRVLLCRTDSLGVQGAADCVDCTRSPEATVQPGCICCMRT